MAEQIFHRSVDGRLTAMREEPYDAERVLQELVAEYPEILAGDQMTPSNHRRWLLIGREVGIPDREDASNRWSVDHVLIDQDAIPTFVETKQGTNPEIRRAIIGQMLEYATHSRYWPAHQLRTLFEQTRPTDDPHGSVEIAQLLDIQGEPDIDAFWERVRTNLEARKIRLLFVADEIPLPLVRVIEFLNEEMPHIEAFAVEVKQFRGEGGMQTLVPHVLGRASAASSISPRATITEADFYARFPDHARDTARAVIAGARAAGASLEWGSSGVSIRGRCTGFAKPITVAWLYPTDIPQWGKTRAFTFGWGAYIADEPGFPAEARELLRAYAQSFAGLAHTGDASSKGVEANYIALADAEHVLPLINRMQLALSELAAL